MPNVELIFFLLVALIVVATGIAMLLSRNAIYSVLFLVANFAAVAVLYMLLGAPFIALAQVTVYAGAIMVLFLFVVMLLGAERMPEKEHIPGQRWLAIAVFAVLLVEAVVIIVLQAGLTDSVSTPMVGFSSPVEIGMALFTRYSLAFELTSVILVVAAIGAILLTKKEKDKQEAP